MSMRTKPSIALIGAGIAGLSCASELHRLNYPVALFDKSRSVGGRMSRRVYDLWEADHGAQYFTAKSDLFKAQVGQWATHGVVDVWTGQLVRLISGQIKQDIPDATRYVGVPSMNSPAQFLSSQLKVHSEKTIVKIERNQHGWVLYSAEDGRHANTYDHLVVALPPMQALKLVESHSGALSQLCQSAHMLPCWTLISYFKNSLNLPFDGAFVEDSIFSWMARNNSKPGRSSMEVWVSQASNRWSQDRVNLKKQEIEPVLLEEFRNITGYEPTHFQTHLWRYAKLAEDNQHQFAMDHSADLSLCGDWLKHSTIEDAWTSGLLLAQAISREYESI